LCSPARCRPSSKMRCSSSASTPTTSATSCTSTASSSPWTRSTWWVLTSTSTARRPHAARRTPHARRSLALRAPFVRQNFTVCLSGWDQRVYYPNQAMLKAQFVNLSKSLNKWEVIYVYVDADTSPDILLKIQEECDRVRLEHKGEYGIGWRCRFAASEPPYKLGIEMVCEDSVGVDLERRALARPDSHTLSHSRYALRSLASTTGRTSSARRLRDRTCTRRCSACWSPTVCRILGLEPSRDDTASRTAAPTAAAPPRWRHSIATPHHSCKLHSCKHHYITFPITTLKSRQTPSPRRRRCSP
jgi:hypothetical protein